MPAVEHRPGEDVFELAQRPVEIGVHPARGESVERPHHQEDVGRKAEHQGDDVDRDGAEDQIDGVEARSRDPFDVFGGVVHGVEFPQLDRMEGAMGPIEAELAGDQIEAELPPERQARQRPMAVIEEGDETIGGVDAEQIDREHHGEADAGIAREHRHDEPVTEVGDEALFLPPRLALVAGREPGEAGEGHRHEGHVGQDARDGVGEAGGDV